MAKKTNSDLSFSDLNKVVYKDFDDEVIPRDFIQEGWALRKDKSCQWIEDLNGEKRAIKCSYTNQWCKGKAKSYFSCFGCPYLYLEPNSKKEEKQFIKNDSGKLQWSLMPFEQLEDVVRVLMNGAKKYERDNWKKCDDINRYKDSLMRHVTAYIEGQKFDTGPGGDNLHHLAHAICNCLFILYFDKAKIEDHKKWMEVKEQSLMEQFEDLKNVEKRN